MSELCYFRILCLALAGRLIDAGVFDSGGYTPQTVCEVVASETDFPAPYKVEE